MMTEFARALLLIAIALTGLYLANRLYDYGVPHWVSRKLPHLCGGLIYILLPFLFHSSWYPIVLSSGFTLILLGANLFRPHTFRGTGGSGRPHIFAEVNFPLAGTVSILILWSWLEQPYLAVLPPAFMGIGDAVTGIIRSATSKVESKNWNGSLGMLIMCLLLASLVQPFWIGMTGAVVATVMEKVTRAKGFLDDNLTLTLGSMIAITLSYLLWSS